MRIALVDYYSPGILYKDPAQITLGLRDIGVDAIFVARNCVNECEAMQAPFPLLTSTAIETAEFWRGSFVDVVLLISRLDPGAEKIAAAIKTAGLRLVLKADSDGTLGYPLVPNYLRTLSWRKSPIHTLLRNMKWRVPIRRYVGKKIDQIALADAVMVESPKARSNVLSILRYWGCESFGSKIHFVPNPVAPDVFSVDAMIEKQSLVMAVGRWHETGSKNTEVMVKALAVFLRECSSYRAVVVGSGQNIVTHLAEQIDRGARARLDIVGTMDHASLAKRLADAQILFMPSRMESFGIVAAEALCVGCSIVVTPIESLEYLVADNFSGTVASGFGKSSVKQALLSEAKRWGAGDRSPREIAEYWRARLGRREIASYILAIATATPDGRGDGSGN